MAETRVEEWIALTPQEAFEVYVNSIDTWWPRQGVFPYSFAPRGTRPKHIKFDVEGKKRLYEEFEDGTEYEIGKITKLDPPSTLEYTWKDPTWAAAVHTSIVFRQHEAGGSIITMEQEGFSEAGVPELPPYYQIGNRQTLAGFVAHCQAISELKKLPQAPGS